jgi:hypothetical protein
MNFPYPRGAALTIAEARANGLKPAETVLIVLAGNFDWPNPQIYLNPEQTYRWDWLRGLGVVVLIDSKTRLGHTLQDIDRVEPSQLDVIDVEQGLGWHVVRTTPFIRAVRWPKAWVSDWLGRGIWHRELNESKVRFAMQAANTNQRIAYLQEAVWN